MFSIKAYRRLFAYIALFWIIDIQHAIVMPAFGASWFGDCDANQTEDECNFDYTKYNFWNSLFQSVRGLLGFLFSGFVGLLSDSYGRKLFIIIPAAILAINYSILSLIYVNIYLWLSLEAFNGIFDSSSALGAVVTAYVSDTLQPYPSLKTIGFSIVLGVLALSILIGTGVASGIAIIWDARTVFLTIAIGFFVTVLYVIFIMPETVRDETRKTFSWNSVKNPFKPLTHIIHNRLILYLGITQFFSQMMAVSVPVTIIYINDQMNINDENESVLINMILFLSMSVSAVIYAGVIVPCLQKRLNINDLQLIITAIIALICSTIAFSIIAFITDSNGDNEDVEVYCIVIILVGSVFFGAYVLMETGIKAIIGKYFNENEQGLAFGVCQSCESIMTIIGPFTFGYGYNLSKDQLGIPSLLYYFIVGLLLIALFMVLGPLRHIINDLKETGEKYTLIKNIGSIDYNAALLKMDDKEDNYKVKGDRDYVTFDQ